MFSPFSSQFSATHFLIQIEAFTAYKMEKADHIIDIQAFHDKKGEFLPKEIALIGSDCNFFAHWIINPPYNRENIPKGILATNSYLTCFHHGIEWFNGESDLEDVLNSLREVARNSLRIYTKEYKKWSFSKNCCVGK